MGECNSFHTETGEPRCWGTREKDECSCGGDRARCDFYPEVRAEGDFISRKAAIIGLAATSLLPHQIDEAADALQLVPAADVVEVRHGRWTFDDFDGDGWDYQCSECGGYSKGSYDYCYHCGAKMDRWKMEGGQDNEPA